MKDEWLNCFLNRLYLKVEGKNINRFIKKLSLAKINLLKVKPVDKNVIYIEILKKDYLKIKEIKTIYNITIVDSYGFDTIKTRFKKNKYIIVFIMLGILLFYSFTNTIFEIEVIHSSLEIRELVSRELSNNGIKVYSFRKNYKELQKIKNKILTKQKDKIEWLEIESIGTKYVVKVEERILNEEKEEAPLQDIVAKKSAILLNIDAKSGVITREINDYVKKGDVVISGSVKLNEEVKNIVPAVGRIYGEVWYKVLVEYPLYYKESKITNNNKNVLALKIFGHVFEIFNFNKYKNREVYENIILKNNLLPISLVIQKQTELKVIDENYTVEQATNRAILEATLKIKSNLSGKEKIISTKKLKVEQNNSRIIVEVFFAVCEDITETRKIEIQDIED